jgi:hypothetical protein
VLGNVRKNQETPGTKNQEAKKLGKSFVPKNRIPRPIFHDLIKLGAVCAKLYLFALANRRVLERQGHNRAFPLRTKTKLSHIV